MLRFIAKHSSVSRFKSTQRQSNGTRLWVETFVCAVAMDGFSIGSKTESFVASANLRQFSREMYRFLPVNCSVASSIG